MEKCECVKKWIEEVKDKFCTDLVLSSIPWNTETLGYKRSQEYKGRYRWSESKDFKFCPHCGKKLKEDHA